ncbi:MAG: hypothetical protein P8Y45_21685 [Exilibacterium sp.]
MKKPALCGAIVSATHLAAFDADTVNIRGIGIASNSSNDRRCRNLCGRLVSAAYCAG